MFRRKFRNSYIMNKGPCGPRFMTNTLQDIGGGGSHGLEARATGATGSYLLPQTLTPNPLPGSTT